MNTRYRFLLSALAAVAVACGSPDQSSKSAPPADAKTPAKADSQPMAGMHGMNASPTAAQIQEMEMHLKTLDGKPRDQLKGLLMDHRQRVANLIAALNDEMRSMNMPPDAAWRATVDSLRQDLVHLADLSASELVTAMPAHRGRIVHMIAMHREMAAKMKM
jgi:hypothetical protein